MERERRKEKLRFKDRLNKRSVEDTKGEGRLLFKDQRVKKLIDN